MNEFQHLYIHENEIRNPFHDWKLTKFVAKLLSFNLRFAEEDTIARRPVVRLYNVGLHFCTEKIWANNPEHACP